MDRRDYSIDLSSVKLLDSPGPGAVNVGKREEEAGAPNATQDENQAKYSDTSRKILTNQMKVNSRDLVKMMLTFREREGA